MAYQRILVPYDGSPASDRGLDEAIRLARAVEGSLVVLHVVDTTRVLGMGEMGSYVTQVLDDLRIAGATLVDAAAQRARSAMVPCETQVVDASGKAVSDVIVDESRKRKADVVVMGTHGRRGLSRMVMGSDAEGVLRESAVPVLLVRAAS